MNISIILTASLALLAGPFADPPATVSKSWIPAVYRELVVGKSTRKDVVRILGKPELVGTAADSNPPIPLYAYQVVDPVKGRLEIYFRGAVVMSMALYPTASLSRADVVRLLGENFLDVRYAAEPCLGRGGAGPMYEDADGDVEHLEYRNRGIAVALQLTKVEAILYVDRAFGPTHSRCDTKRR